MGKRRNKPVGAHRRAPLPPPPDQPPPADLPIWECPNCGQQYFGAHPPDLCAYCCDFTTWRPVRPAEPLS